MKILLTGALGFVGSNVLDMLNRDNRVTHVYAVDSNSIGLSRFYIQIPAPKISYINIDLSRDCLSCLPDNVDCVIHLAASGSVIDSISRPRENLESNLLSTFNILEYMASRGIRRLIFSSTGGALMGDTPPPVSEKSVPAPISPYGASKLACEGYIHAYSRLHGIRSTVFRFGNVFGPYSWHKKGVVNKLIHSFMNRSPFVIYGDGYATRDYIYSEDIASAVATSLFSSASFPGCQIFHLATGKETSLLELHNVFCDIFSFSTPIEFVQARAGEVYRNYADFSLARSVLGFQPKMSLSLCMRHTVAWFKSYASSLSLP